MRFARIKVKFRCLKLNFLTNWTLGLVDEKSPMEKEYFWLYYLTMVEFAEFHRIFGENCSNLLTKK